MTPSVAHRKTNRSTPARRTHKRTDEARLDSTLRASSDVSLARGPGSLAAVDSTAAGASVGNGSLGLEVIARRRGMVVQNSRSGDSSRSFTPE